MISHHGPNPAGRMAEVLALFTYTNKCAATWSLVLVAALGGVAVGCSRQKACTKCVVLIGDSITANWQSLTTGRELAGLKVVNRGIPSDDTAHMLARFDSDVIRNRPRVVVILGGINDLVRVPLVSTEQNLETMTEKAERNNIRVVLATLPPAGRRTDERNPTAAVSSDDVGGDEIRVLNDWIRNCVARKHYAVADYYAILADDRGSYLSDLTADGIHPSTQGYERMEQLLRDAIQASLTGRK